MGKNYSKAYVNGFVYELQGNVYARLRAKLPLFPNPVRI